MQEFDALDRCAAYVAARGTLEAVQRCTPSWPKDLAAQAKSAATDILVMTATSLGYQHATAARRRHVRAAIKAAIDLAATCEVARALGEETEDAQRSAGRTIAMLGMLFHASSSAYAEPAARITGASQTA